MGVYGSAARRSSGGKGDQRRPEDINKFHEGWERVFGKMQVRFAKLRDDAIIPRQQTDGSAGFDLHAVDAEIVQPGEVLVVHTGIAVELPDDHEGQIRPRSSTTIDYLTVPNSPGTIDADYRGEVCVIVHNFHRDRPYEISVGDRIAQLVVCPIAQRVQPVEVTYDELTDTTRGTGGFGSTGRN